MYVMFTDETHSCKRVGKKWIDISVFFVGFFGSQALSHLIIERVAFKA